MWLTTFAGAMVAFTIGMTTLATGEYLLSHLTPLTLPIGGTLTPGGGVATTVAGIAVIVSAPK